MPPPSHLALISTLVVHPSLNTRAKTTDRLQASNLAAEYLRLVQKTVGPSNARFAEAYVFPKRAGDSRRGTSGRRQNGSPDVENTISDGLGGDLATKNSLWTQGGDFWAVVGWAFNCSVRHKKRWERWHLWLEHMAYVLESDWNMRDDKDKESSLIVRYAVSGGGDRRIVRAIFADGSSKNTAEFGEIWKNEIVERKEKRERPIRKIDLDIDEGNYGDYLEESSASENSEEEVDGTNKGGLNDDDALRKNLLLATASSSFPDGTMPLGGPQALSLRLRLLSLLSSLSTTLPGSFTSLSSLYDLYLTHIRPLPLPTFSAILSPPFLLDSFPPDAASSLVQYLASSLLETAAPTPSLDDLTQAMIVKCYLPWAANTMDAADNANVGTCVEVLLRMFDRIVGLKWTKEMEQAALDGVQRREEKARKGYGKRRKGEAGGVREGLEGEVDKASLSAGGQRIKMVITMANRD